MGRNGVLPTTEFACWKGQGTCDACLCVSHTLQNALDSGQEARQNAFQIKFSAAFDRVNHQGILYSIERVYRLCSVGIGGSVLSILTEFLSNRSQHVMVMVVVVNWLTFFQECRREVFWVRYCSSRTLWSFFTFWKIS